MRPEPTEALASTYSTIAEWLLYPEEIDPATIDAETAEAAERAGRRVDLREKQRDYRLTAIEVYSRPGEPDLRLGNPDFPVASLQPPYSMLRRDIEEDLLGYCGQNNIGVICYSPVQKGLLTGKFSEERVANLAADDHRRNDPNFRGNKLKANLELVEKLKPIAHRSGRTLAQLAITWVLRRQEVTAAIVGARKKEQIEETVSAGNRELAAEDLREIETLLKGLE